MGRFPNVAGRISLVGAVALVAGSMMIIGVAVQSLSAPTFADTSAFELFCTNTPIGDLVFNDVVISGSLSPATPAPGQQFNLTGFQAQLNVPADVAQEAAAVGNQTISGTASVTIAATGATPASIPTGPLAYGQAIPNPIPPSGITLTEPSTPATVGPFTATSSNVALSLGSSISLTFNDAAFPEALPPLECSAYANDLMPSGLAQGIPPGLPISPVIASAGTPPPPPTTPTVTGAYELYCPHTPVGDLVFNDVTTSATISPAAPSAGSQFQVTGYQTDIPIPPGAVTAAAGLGNSGFDGLATSEVDAYGTTSSALSTGSMGFNLPIPDPVPSTSLGLDIPSSTTSVGPFTALGGPITIAQNESILVVAKLSSKAFKMSCNAYPNDSIATSGSTGTPPAATPIRPIIAVGSASGTPISTTTTTFQPGGPGQTNQTPGAPYELYCSGTPVGDIAVNDVTTTGSITPTSLNEGDQFSVSDLQTTFTIPQNVAQQAENLGLTSLSGDLSLFLDVTGTEGDQFGPGPVVTFSSGTASSGVLETTTPGVTPTTVVTGPPISYPGPFPYPFPGEDDLSFSVTLPSPVPSTGVQFTATPAPGSQPDTFIAAGGPINVLVSGADLDVSAFGDQFGIFCDTLTNNTVPTGLSIQEPYEGLTEPLITTGSATVVPPPPTRPGGPGAYELYCPNTPVGNIVLNDVNTTGTITPADPAPGEQFNVTGYQSTINLPASIASAAAALGNTDLGGTATASIDASGATPAQISTGTMNFDTPLPPFVPSSGVTLTVPSTASTIGPFTASGGVISIAEDASVQLDLIVSGSDLTLRCSAYANNSEPSGIVEGRPPGSPMSPVIASTGGGSPGSSSPTLSVGPSTSVSSGESVTLTGSGFQDDSPGNVLECNNTPSQPTVNLGAPVSNAVPVGCTAPTFNLVTTSSTGTLSTTYAVAAGTVGPPCGASTDIITTCPQTDSAGQDPAADAALYPCPPTPAQQAAGITCTLTFGDAAGDSATTPILFNNEGVTPTTVPSTTTPDPATQSTTTQPVAPVTASSDPSGDSGSTTTPSSNATNSSDPASSTPTTHPAATKAGSSNDDPAGTASPSVAASPVRASSSALAFTGPGAATGWVVVAGSALIVLGLAMLLLVDTPRRLRWALVGSRRRAGRNLGGPPPTASSTPAVRTRDALWRDGTC